MVTPTQTKTTWATRQPACGDRQSASGGIPLGEPPASGSLGSWQPTFPETTTMLVDPLKNLHQLIRCCKGVIYIYIYLRWKVRMFHIFQQVQDFQWVLPSTLANHAATVTLPSSSDWSTVVLWANWPESRTEGHLSPFQDKDTRHKTAPKQLRWYPQQQAHTLVHRTFCKPLFLTGPTPDTRFLYRPPLEP